MDELPKIPEWINTLSKLVEEAKKEKKILARQIETKPA
jgi:hypothetical protein